jgi:hypothetical protein
VVQVELSPKLPGKIVIRHHAKEVGLAQDCVATSTIYLKDCSEVTHAHELDVANIKALTNRFSPGTVPSFCVTLVKFRADKVMLSCMEPYKQALESASDAVSKMLDSYVNCVQRGLCDFQLLITTGNRSRVPKDDGRYLSSHRCSSRKGHQSAQGHPEGSLL